MSLLGTRNYSEQGSLYYQPKHCIVIREIPQNCHRFLLFDSPKTGNSIYFNDPCRMSSFSAMRVLVSSIRASHRRGIHICQWCRTSHDELLWKGSWVNLGIIRKIPQPELPSHITKISYFPPFKVSLKLLPMRWCIFPRFFCGKPSGCLKALHVLNFHYRISSCGLIFEANKYKWFQSKCLIYVGNPAAKAQFMWSLHTPTMNPKISAWIIHQILHSRLVKIHPRPEQERSVMWRLAWHMDGILKIVFILSICLWLMCSSYFFKMMYQKTLNNNHQI